MRNQALDKLIEKEYTTRAQDRMINIMDIGKVFKEARIDFMSGIEIGEAVQNAINKYTEAA